MLKSTGEMCEFCKQNIYEDVMSGKKKCGCNTVKEIPEWLKILDAKRLNEKEFICKKCGEIEIIYTKRKINSNKIYCKKCKKKLTDSYRDHQRKKERAKKLILIKI